MADASTVLDGLAAGSIELREVCTTANNFQTMSTTRSRRRRPQDAQVSSYHGGGLSAPAVSSCGGDRSHRPALPSRCLALHDVLAVHAHRNGGHVCTIP